MGLEVVVALDFRINIYLFFILVDSIFKYWNATMLQCYNATIVIHEIEDSAELMKECMNA
jgi:hypothetical protein